MKPTLALLLTIVLTCKLAMTAAAQEPETGAFGQIPQHGQVSSETIPESAIAVSKAVTDLQALWAALSWCGVEIQARLGTFETIGLPATAAPDSCDDAVCENRSDVEPDRPDLLGFLAVNPGSNGGSSLGPSPVSNVLGLPTLFLECTTADELGVAMCPVDYWSEPCKPAVQFNAGGSVCFFTEGGLGRGMNLNACSGAGGSLWLGCTMPTGLEVRIGACYFAGQQFFSR